MNVAVIPCYNEEKHILNVIRETSSYVDYVIVVDDGSIDNTKDILSSLRFKNVIVLNHLVNMGRGVALKTGVEYIKNKLNVRPSDNIIFTDADMQHNPKDIPKFISLLDSTQTINPKRKQPFEMVFHYLTL